MLRRIGLIILAASLAVQPAGANFCAIPGRDGAAQPSGVVNTYYPGTANANIGATSIRIGTPRGAAQGIAAGDLLLVIQMQDATINTSNNAAYGDGVTTGYGSGYTAVRQSGAYEFVRAVSVTATTVTIQGATGGGLVNSYAYAAPTSSPRRTFQVIRVPQYSDAEIAGTVTAAPWNGTTGGVVAIDVARRLTFSGGTIDVAGQGFRGGGGRNLGGGSGTNSNYRFASTVNWGGSKGEGIAGTPRYVIDSGAVIDNTAEGLANGSYGRGAPANAGGGGNDGIPNFNFQNAGGGGGGNGGPGGMGGHSWCTTAPDACPQVGGHPGGAVAELGVARLTMGGGGGAGANNDETGTPAFGYASSGASGGGIVLIRAGEVAGTGTIDASGADGNNTLDNDASGGGGAGGSILISAVRPPSGLALSLLARGGDGGSNTGGGSAHGPGGGGGGGFIAASFPVTGDVAGGAAGTTVNGGSYGPAYGATAGNGGAGIVISGANIPGNSSGGECTPTLAKSFGINPTSPGVPTPLLLTLTNNNPTRPLTGVAFTDSYPAGLSNAAAPAPADSCGAATLAAAAGGSSFMVGNGTVAAGGSCTYSVRTVVGDYQSRTNSIAAGGVTGAYNVAVASRDPASATLAVAPPLTIAKWSQASADPANGSSNAKAIPGARIVYTIAVTNPAPYTVTTDSIEIVDATPSNLGLYVGPDSFLFQQGSPSSSLSFSFAGFASTADDVDFSNDGAASWTYVPADNGSGFDPAVTHVRFRPKGAMAPASSFSLLLAYIVR